MKKPDNFPLLKNDVILRVVRGQDAPYTPVWIMRQAGRYLPEFRAFRENHDFFEICRTPEFACEITLQPIRRFKLDAAIIFSDILVIPQALGMEVEMRPGIGPVLPVPLTDATCLAKLNFNVDIAQALNYVYEAITLTRHKLNGEVPLIGFSGAPWTLMAYMVEGGGSKTHSKAKKWLYQDPVSSHRLLSLLARVVTDHLVQQTLAGAQLLQIFESHAGALSPYLFDTFALPYLKQIYEGVGAQLRDDHGWEEEACPPIIMYAKDGHYALTSLSTIGFQVIGLDWSMDPEAVREIVGDSVVLQGNLDPCALYSSDENLEKRVKVMMDSFGRKPHIVNLGHGIYPDVKPEHVAVFINLVHSYSKR